MVQLEGATVSHDDVDRAAGAVRIRLRSGDGVVLSVFGVRIGFGVGGRVRCGERLLKGFVYGCAFFLEALVNVVFEVGPELPLGAGEVHAVLGALGAGDRGHHRGQVEFQILGVGDFL